MGLTLPGGGSGGSSVARLPFNVKNYGAVGDNSTDDTAALTACVAAMTAAALAGANVSLVFPAGVYKTTTGVLIRNVDNLHISSQGATISSSAGTTHVLYLVNVHGFSIEGDLTVTHSATGARQIAADGLCMLGCADGTVSGVRVGYVRSIGIRPQASKRITISGCSVKGSLADGIGAYSGYRTSGSTASISSGSNTLTINDTTNAALSSNDVGTYVVVPGAGAAGAALVSTITAVTSSTVCTIANNASTTVSGKAVLVGGGCSRIIITGNRVESSGDDAYSVVGYNNANTTAWTANNDNVVITGNTTLTSGARGIAVVGCVGFVVQGNVIKSPFRGGINVVYDPGAASQGSSEGVVSHNVVQNCGTGASAPSIQAGSTSTTYPVTDVLVTENIVKGGSSNHIYVGASSSGTSEITVSRNRCSGAITSSHGIQAENVAGVSVVGNRESGAWLAGIQMNGNTAGVRCQDNDVTNTNGGSVGFPAMNLTDASAIITGNYVNDAAGNSIDASSATGAFLQGNITNNGVVYPGPTKAPFFAIPGSVATSAGAGGSGSAPATVAGYQQVQIGGTNYKIPLYTQ